VWDPRWLCLSHLFLLRSKRKKWAFLGSSRPSFSLSPTKQGKRKSLKSSLSNTIFNINKTHYTSLLSKFIGQLQRKTERIPHGSLFFLSLPLLCTPPIIFLQQTTSFFRQVFNFSIFSITHLHKFSVPVQITTWAIPFFQNFPSKVLYNNTFLCFLCFLCFQVQQALLDSLQLQAVLEEANSLR